MRNGIMMLGDYQPVRTMRNGVQIAGYQNSEKSGEDLEWGDTYNDVLTGTIGGKSVQNGTPTPASPVPIVSAAGTATASGRNLFDKSLPLARTIGAVKTETATGIRMTTASPGSALYGYINLGRIKFYAGLTIRLRSDVSSNINGQPGAMGLAYSDNINFNPATTLTSNVNATQINITFTIPLSYANSEGYLGLIVNASRLAESVKGDWLQYDNLQLELGSTAHPYLPYRAPSSLTFALPGIPLPASATVWTYIDEAGQKWWADTEEWGKFDGVWRWRRAQRIWTQVFDGTETWSKNTYRYQLLLSVNTVQSEIRGEKILCNYFKPGYQGSQYAGIGNLTASVFSTSATGAYNTYFGCEYDAITTVADFKSWLAAQYSAGTPVTVLYQLATPIITYHDDPPLLTHPHYTAVSQDGEVKARLALTAKIIGG